jgi:NADH-quinone oxidoreductase subunit N
MTQNDIISTLPLIVLTSWAVLLLVVDLWIPRERKAITAILAVVGLSLALGLNLAHSRQPQVVLNGLAVVDGFTLFLDAIFLIGGLVGVGLAYDYLKRMDIERGEYYSLLLFAVSGMMLMTYAYDLLVVFLALELLSIPLYVLAGFAIPRLESEESSLKYFLLGTFSAAFVLYGIALIFGASGHTDLVGILAVVQGGLLFKPLFIAGVGLLLVGFAFKTGIVPFHQWVPDVYQGAPTPVTGFMSVGAKAAGITALLRVFLLALPDISAQLVPVLWGLAALTMILGNIVAISQNNMKRLLGYSSIANGGYLLMAFVSYGNNKVAGDAVSAMLYYLAAYALTSFTAWAVVTAMERQEGKGLELQDFSGLYKKYPLLALALAIAMFSYTGVPPTIGFWGKFYLFRTAVEGGFSGLALLGLLTSLVSAFYYLRVVVFMYMRPGDPQVNSDRWLNVIAVLFGLAIVVLSLFPGQLLNLASLGSMR